MTEFISLKITDLSSQGEGVGRDSEGCTVFVPHAAVGDRLRVRIVKQKKTYAHGRIEEILEQGEGRCDAICPLFGECGGCDWQHLNLEQQHSWKLQIFKETLRRIGKINLPEDIRLFAGDSLYQTRTRVRLQISANGKPAFFRKGSHHKIEVERCPVLAETLEQAIAFLLQDSERKAWPEGELCMLTDGDSLALSWHLKDPQALNTRGRQRRSHRARPKKKAPHLQKPELWQETWERLQEGIPNVKGLSIWSSFGFDAKKLFTHGEPWIYRDEPKVRYRPEGFAQASFFLNHLLFEAIWSILKEPLPKTVLEVYAGRGNLSYRLAERGIQVLALEGDALAIEDGILGTKGWSAQKNLRFRVFHDQRNKLRSQWKESSDPELLLLDPPRRGLSTEIREQILAWLPPKILYVSCDAATLARDLKELIAGGYCLKDVAAVDLIPQTAHVEAVVLLEISVSGQRLLSR